MRDGDVVQFRIDVSNTSDTLGPDYQSSVRGLDIWDKLPVGVPCASVANPDPPSGAGVTFTCLDPADAGYPAGGSGRSLLRWVFDDSDAQAIDAGARRTLTYDFTVPENVSVAVRLTDDAGVRSYQAFTNLPGVAATYYPVSNIDTSVPVADQDAPRADDPSNVVVANVALAKTGTTAITEDNNNTPDQATIGEEVTYTVTATVPYGTSVYRGVLTDTLPTGLSYVSATADYSIDAGATWSSSLPVGTVLANSATTGDPLPAHDLHRGRRRDHQPRLPGRHHCAREHDHRQRPGREPQQHRAVPEQECRLGRGRQRHCAAAAQLSDRSRRAGPDPDQGSQRHGGGRR